MEERELGKKTTPSIPLAPKRSSSCTARHHLQWGSSRLQWGAAGLKLPAGCCKRAATTCVAFHFPLDWDRPCVYLYKCTPDVLFSCSALLVGDPWLFAVNCACLVACICIACAFCITPLLPTDPPRPPRSSLASAARQLSASCPTPARCQLRLCSCPKTPTHTSSQPFPFPFPLPFLHPAPTSIPSLTLPLFCFLFPLASPTAP